MNTHWPPIWIGFAFYFCQMLTFPTLTSSCFAQEPDRIWIEPKRPTSVESDWNTRAIQKIDAKIIDFDATKISYVVVGDEAESVAAASRVLWVERGEVSDLEAEAIQLYIDGKYSESLTKLPTILQQRPPVWRQQWLTMLAAGAAWKSRRAKIALELVSQLDRRPLPLMTVSWLPVAWENGSQHADSVSQAEQRIQDPSPAVQLVAASWMLSSASRSTAVNTLKALTTNPRSEIANLAKVLLWRTSTPPEVEKMYREWQKEIDALPMTVQSGPIQLLVDKLRSAGLGEEAKQLQWSLELTPIHPVH